MNAQQMLSCGKWPNTACISMKREDSAHIETLTQSELVCSSPTPLAEPVPASVYIKSKIKTCSHTSCGQSIVLSTESLPLMSFPGGLGRCCWLIQKPLSTCSNSCFSVKSQGAFICHSRLEDRCSGCLKVARGQGPLPTVTIANTGML